MVNKLVNLGKAVGGWYLNLKIIGKLTLGFGLLAAVVLLNGSVQQRGIYELAGRLDRVIDDQLEPLIYVNDIRAYLGELEVITRDALINEDQAALGYIRDVFFPNMVVKTVEYSFQQLLRSPEQPFGSRFFVDEWIGRWLKPRSSSLSGTTTRTTLEELAGYWSNYAESYRRLLAEATPSAREAFFQEAGGIRYHLIGGLDRLVETSYRTQAILAKTDAEEIFRRQQRFSGIFLALTMLLAVGVSMVTAWTIIKPLRQLAEVSRKIGSGQLIIGLPENRRDEFGEVAQCFNGMSGDLKRLIEAIREAAVKVTENSQKLMTSSTVTNSVSQQMLEAMAQVAQGAEDQQKKVAATHQLIQSMTDGVDVVNQVIQRAEALSKESLIQAAAGEAAVTIVQQKMGRLQEFVSESEQSMKKLHLLSQEIQGIVATVTEVTEQSNLLALNAAIESARAGEAGRGFAVVAEAMGDLALRAKQATLEVGRMMKRIQGTSEDLEQLFIIENQEIRAGETSVTSLAQSFLAINDAVQDVNRQLEEVALHTCRLAREQQEVAQTMEQIAVIADQHKDGTTATAASVEQQFASTQEIVGVSQILTGWGSQLREAVGKFQIRN